jgi:hypothetical protein
MADFDTQVNVGMNVDGVITGTEKAKRSVRDLGESARGAGNSLGGIGDGAGQSAQKVESATKSMIQGIQRTTAATEAGDKSTRAYQESLARLRGVDVAALRPYLDQLDQAKLKSQAAAKANESLGARMNALKVGALAVFAAGAAFLAYAKNINDGVDALNDLKDASGASIENISALEDIALRTGTSFDTVGTSLVKLNQVLNASKPGSDTEKALTAIGLSVKDLKALDPAEAFRRIAVELNKFADDGNKARLSQELFGKSLKEVAPLLKDVAEAGGLVATVTTEQAEAAEAFNKQLFSLQKNATDFGRTIVADLIPSLSNLAIEMAAAKKTSTGFFDGLITQLTQNPFKSVGENAATYRKEIESLEEDRLRYLKSGSDTSAIDASLVTLKRRLEYYKEIQLQQVQIRKNDQSDAETRRLTGAAGGLRSVGEIAAGPDKSAIAAAAIAARAARAEAVKQEIEEVKRMHAGQEAYDKLLAESTKEREKYNEAFAKSADAVAQKVQDLEDEEAALALSASANITLAQAIERVEIARLREKQAVELSYGNEQAAAEIQREIGQREKLATLLDSKAAREASAKSAKDAATEWQKASEQIEQSITDALMRGFESGKGFGENLRDTLVNTFKTMVLRPVISAIVNPVAGAAASALGFSGAATAASSVPTLVNIAGITTAATGALSSGFSLALAGGTGLALEGGAAMVASATGLSSAAAGLAQIAGALAPWALGAVAIASLLKGGEYVKSTGDANITYNSAGQRTLTKTAAQINTNGDTQTTAAADSFVQTLFSSYEKAAKSFGVKLADSVNFGFGSNNSDGGKFRLTAQIGGSGFDTGEIKSSDAAIKEAAQRAVFAALKGSDLPKYLANIFNTLDAGSASSEAINNALSYASSLKQIRDALTETRTPLQILQENVDSAFAKLGTSAATFKADFVAAIDAGITPENLAEYLTLRENLEALAKSAESASGQIVRSLADIASERKSLQDQLDSLTLTSSQLLEKQRNALDESNRALFDQVQAASAAAKATQTFGDALGGLESASFDLENQLLSLQGQSTLVASRTRTSELASLTEGITNPDDIARIQAQYDYNESLRAQVAALNAAQQAAADYASQQQQAAAAAANAAEQVRSAWQSVTDSLIGEARRIRGLLGTPAQSFAQAQAAFSIAAAQASAGDQTAAKALPELSRVLLTLAEAQATSLVQLQTLQGTTAGTLESIAKKYVGQFGVNIPQFAVGTNYVPQDMLAVVHKGEAIVPAAYNPSNSGSGNDALVAEVQALRQEMAAMRATNEAIAKATTNSDKTLTRVTRGGDAMQTQEFV